MIIDDDNSGFVPLENTIQFENLLTQPLSFKAGDDIRSPFKYEDIVIRPSDIIALWELLSVKHGLKNVFYAGFPTGMKDGSPYLIETRKFATFEDILTFIDDALAKGSYLMLYSIVRVKLVDSVTFVPETAFALRCAVLV